MIKDAKNSFKAWIPHSTGKIYNEDMSLSDEMQTQNQRINMEQEVINYINDNTNSYVISTGEYIKNHLVNEYGLKNNINIINGELLYRNNIYEENKRMEEILKQIDKFDSIILSLGRAERYKNLDKNMLLGQELGIKSVVITQQYFEKQPIVSEYKKLANKTNALLYIDEPFALPQYIVKYYNKPMILLVPSEREIFGLIINEMRRFNKNNVLIVANDRGGLHEQIDDCCNGLLVDLNNISESANKIKKHFNSNDIIKFNKAGQQVLKEKYDLKKNFNDFLEIIIGGKYE